MYLLFVRQIDNSFLIISAKRFLKRREDVNIRVIHDDTGKEVKNSEDFALLVKGDFVMILANESENWIPPTKTLLSMLFEKVFKRCILYDLIDIHSEFNEREMLFIANHMDPKEESVYIKQMRCM